LDVIEELIGAVAREAPLEIREVIYQDPTLILVGDGWSMSVLVRGACDRAAQVVTGEDDQAHIPAVAHTLVGKMILSVRPLSHARPYQPAFVTTDDLLLDRL
jgi:uncharacterized protein (UPF0218 family)